MIDELIGHPSVSIRPTRCSTRGLPARTSAWYGAGSGPRHVAGGRRWPLSRSAVAVPLAVTSMLGVNPFERSDQRVRIPSRRESPSVSIRDAFAGRTLLDSPGGRGSRVELCPLRRRAARLPVDAVVCWSRARSSRCTRPFDGLRRSGEAPCRAGPRVRTARRAPGSTQTSRPAGPRTRASPVDHQDRPTALVVTPVGGVALRLPSTNLPAPRSPAVAGSDVMPAKQEDCRGEPDGGRTTANQSVGAKVEHGDLPGPEAAGASAGAGSPPARARPRSAWSSTGSRWTSRIIEAVTAAPSSSGSVNLGQLAHCGTPRTRSPSASRADVPGGRPARHRLAHPGALTSGRDGLAVSPSRCFTAVAIGWAVAFPVGGLLRSRTATRPGSAERGYERVAGRAASARSRGQTRQRVGARA